MISVETAIRTEQNHPATKGHVVATLNYTSSEDGQSEWYIHDPKPGIVEQTPQMEPRPARIYNARSKSNSFTIDTAGFQLTPFRSGVVDFQNEEDVRTVYYPETEALVKRLTGASRVLACESAVRIDPPVHQEPIAYIMNRRRNRVKIARRSTTLTACSDQTTIDSRHWGLK